MEKSKEQLEREFRIIDEMFPDAQFTPSIDLENSRFELIFKF